MEPSELNVDEDSTVHSQSGYLDRLKILDEDHRSTGGVKFVTNCFGIIGFIKFLGPYYMLIITEQRQIGDIFGHPVYQVTKTAMIELSNSKTRPKLTDSKDENRLSHIIVAWYAEDKLAICGKDIMLTLIARRSRHYAGTRYLKRGVNDEGRVANDVETEQIVYEDVLGARQISSVVQNRGSIPLFWSQETSKLNLKPDIILHEKDKNYEATRLHFENLRKRYGNPIIILNLIKVSTLKSTNALQVLLKVAFEALNLTEYFYYQASPAQITENFLNLSATLKNGFGPHVCDDNNNCGNADYVDDFDDISQDDTCGSSDPGNGIAGDNSEIFSAKRGHLKFAIQSQEFFRTLQRYYSNAYMDAYKQAAINLFLGYFEPQVGKPALWEPESGDEHVLDDETRSKAISTPDVNISTVNALSDGDVSSGTMDNQTIEFQAQGFSKDFVQWVKQGEAFWY
nr:unnamed protein product [Digitaria exilis]